VTGRRRSLYGLDEDIRDHIERETQDNIDRGMTPADARDAALLAFGNVTLAMEDTRAVWVPVWLDQLLQDARYGLRMLRRNPIFSAVVILTLAVGIGLTTAVFSVVNAVLVRPLSYPHAERLFWLATYDERAKGGEEVVVSPEFAVWRDQATSFERLAGFFIDSEPIDTGGEVVQARMAGVTEDFWDLSGARFALGGPPRRGEEGVVLSHAFFERWFHGDAAIVGRPVVRQGTRTIVTGVLQPRFAVQLPPPLWFTRLQPAAIDFYAATVVRRAGPRALGRVFNVVGLAKPGVSMARIREEIDAIRDRETKAHGPFYGPPRLRVEPYADKLIGSARRPLLILLAAVVLVLLIACANIANLLMARGSARQREIAIRTAVGAGRGRVLRQFLVESAILAAAGGAAGLLFARTAIAVALGLIPNAVPRLAETSIDGRVLAFTVAATVLTALLFGFAPAIVLWKASVYDLLKDSARTVSPSGGGLRVRQALVAIELAISVVLLVGAGLMVRSFWRITSYPPGFTPDRVLTLRVQFSGLQYREQTARRAHLDELLRRAQSAPGVEAAGLNSDGDASMLLTVEGAPDLPREQRPTAILSAASGGYAKAIGLRVVRGRWLEDAEPLPVFVVNETLARRVFGAEDPVGRRICCLPWVRDGRPATVVGVVADLRYASLDTGSVSELFVNYGDAGLFAMTLAVRTTGDPAAAAPAIRTLLSSVDRTQPLFDVKPLDVTLADSIAPRRFNLVLFGTFAASALLLAVIGIYGVIAYAVAQRTHEIGVRMALGAQRRQVVRMVVGQGMAMALTGVLAGMAAALALTRVLTSLLYEVTPTDPATFAAVTFLFAAVALAACGGPALKAARVDPIVALRCE
jgi:putative ABC transport system permease protein